MPLPLIPIGKLPLLETSLHFSVRVDSVTYPHPLRSPTTLPPLLTASSSHAFRRQHRKGETHGKVSHEAEFFFRVPIIFPFSPHNQIGQVQTVRWRTPPTGSFHKGTHNTIARTIRLPAPFFPYVPSDPGYPHVLGRALPFPLQSFMRTVTLAVTTSRTASK